MLTKKACIAILSSDFRFDSGDSTFLQRGSPPPPPWRLLPESFSDITRCQGRIWIPHRGSRSGGIAIGSNRQPCAHRVFQVTLLDQSAKQWLARTVFCFQARQPAKLLPSSLAPA